MALTARGEFVHPVVRLTIRGRFLLRLGGGRGVTADGEFVVGLADTRRAFTIRGESVDQASRRTGRGRRVLVDFGDGRGVMGDAEFVFGLEPSASPTTAAHTHAQAGGLEVGGEFAAHQPAPALAPESLGFGIPASSFRIPVSERRQAHASSGGLEVGGGPAARFEPARRYVLDIRGGVVVGGALPATYRKALEEHAPEAAEDVAAIGGDLAAAHRDYLRDVIEPDDEEALALL